MNRLLLFGLLISFFNTLNAQQNPPQPIPPPPPGLYSIYGCDEDQDGIAIFNLNDLVFYYFGHSGGYLNPTYYETPEDLNTQTNPISNPENYIYDGTITTVYGRAELDDGSGNFAITEADLETRFLNNSFDIQEVVQCGQYYEPSCFNLVDPYILFCDARLNVEEFNFEFYNTRDDFDARINQITNPETYIGQLLEETIFVRGESLLTGKVETTQYNIRTIEPPSVNAELQPLTKVDEDNDGIETFDLTQHRVDVSGEGIDYPYYRYYLSYGDLTEELNEIFDPYNFVNTSNPQTIWVRVDNSLYYPGCFETQYCYGYDSFQIVVEPCVDSDNDGLCDLDDSCPNLDNSLIGTACDDGNPCTENDVYTEDCGCEGTFADSDNDGVCDAEDLCPNFDDAIIGTSCDDGNDCTENDVYTEDCGCEGTFVDSDNDGVCDAEDLCPGGDDNIDTDQDGTPDACQPVCVYRTEGFGNGSLTHTGTGTNIAEFVFPTDSQNISFSITGLDSKLKGKPSNQYIEEVSISYINENDETLFMSSISASDGQSADIAISVVVKKIIVSLTDGQDGNSGSSSMQVNLGDITYCVLEYPCLPDSDGDGICDEDDQCPDFDDNLIGTSCDDGNPCTTNDIYQTDCGCAGVFTDADADGVCAGDDPDDSDACVPNPESSNCQPCTNIVSDDFESGFGNWIDGGNDVSLVNNNGNGGSASVRLRDDSGISSSIYTNSLNLSSYNELSINFFYSTSGMGQGDGFFLELSQNGGGSFSVLKRYAFQTDFDNNQQYFETFSLPTPLTTTSILRIRGDGSSNKSAVYLDDIVLTDCVVSEFTQTSTSRIRINRSELKIFPNPATSILNIAGIGEFDKKVELFTVVGQQVLERKLNIANGGNLQIDLSKLASGIYMVMVSDSNDRVSHQFKLVLQK